MKNFKNFGSSAVIYRTMRNDYKQLRKINPEAARKAVLEYLKTNNHNISDAAAAFGITRTVVYDIIRRSKAGDLKDRSRVPKNQPRKTPDEIQNIIIKCKKETQLKPKELTEYLKKHEGLDMPTGTIRHILKRAEKNHILIDIYLPSG